METGTTRRLSRRQMLKGAALLLGSIPGAVILEACGPSVVGAQRRNPARRRDSAKAAAATAPAAAEPPRQHPLRRRRPSP